MSLLNRKTTLKASTSVASAAQTFLPSLSDRNHHSDYEGQGDPQKLQDALILVTKKILAHMRLF